ncbi:MAG: SpoIID/LytB domain-containing protein [candidate division Zixibacteria bacterium]|nr:SpoIID/LytB domain-containing protein [candidate division Zixibacteria bacterium]
MFALRRYISITLSFLLALLMLNCAQMPAVRQGVFYSQVRQPMVAVKLLEGQKILVSPANNFAIRCFKNGIQIANYFSTADIEVKVNSSSIIWGQKNQSPMESNLSKVIFEPKSKENWLSLNGKRYRGALEIVLDQNKNLLVALNIVNLEDYLKGVVPAEMGKRKKGELEALKAQAIAARTYALSKMGQYDGAYDLKATIYDQVYAGMDGEESLVNQAVDETRGKILTYQDKLIQAYYYANCGGRTESLEEVWSGMGEPYLLSVEDRDFCTWAGNYRWEEEWNIKELEHRLFEFLSERESIDEEDFGRLLDLKILDRAPSGRVKVLLVSTDRGDFTIEKDKIRWALKRTKDIILPSTLFDLEVTRGIDGSWIRVKAVGKGNGHGIGMCQTGAIGMANRGFSYSEILAHYYPGTKILKYY